MTPYLSKYSMLLKEFTRSFIYSESVFEALVLGKETKQGVLLYGPGGHGKTAMSQFVAENLYSKADVHVTVFGTGTRTPAMLGGTDMPELLKTGNLLYKLDRSFMSYKVAIFEELFDAPKPTIEQLKYILSEKKFPQNGKDFLLVSEMLVACTNYVPREWAQNASDKALLGRFPLRLEVKWESYQYEDFDRLFKAVFNAPCPLVAEACALCHKAKVEISPRDAVKIVDQYLVAGSLSVFAMHEDVSNNKALLHQILRLDQNAKDLEEARIKIGQFVAKFKQIPSPSSDYLKNERYMMMLSQLDTQTSQLKGTDNVLKEINDLLTKVRTLRAAYAGKQKTLPVPEELEEFNI